MAQWTNHAYEICEAENRRNNPDGRSVKPVLHRANSATYFTQGAIRKASAHWYKMRWQFTGTANDLWGEEVQGFSEVISGSPLSTCPNFRDHAVSPVRVRFFNMLSGDDAANDFRCAFLKFGDNPEEGPLDLAFTTGRVSCFDSTSALQTFLSAVDGDEDRVRDWALMDPKNYFALVDGLRRFPKCWTSLDYYCHSTFSVDTGEGRKLVRFRLHGDDDISSRLSKQEQEVAWQLGRPDIELPSNTYLHENMRNITVNNRRMTLQVQMRNYDDRADQNTVSSTSFWDEKEFPWIKLSNIVLTYNVPKINFERAKFNFTNLPDYMTEEIPTNFDNPGSLINIQEKVLSSSVRKKKPETDPTTNGKNTTFLIHVETGNHLFSGTDAGVYIALYGTKGRTRQVLLDKVFHDDFERGSKEAYYITEPAIGEILYVQVSLIGGKLTFARNWFLSDIVVFDLNSRRMVEIPCYRWITDRITLPTGKGTLPQYETNIARKYLRRLAIDHDQEVYRWAERGDGLPGRIESDSYNDLPIDQKFATNRDLEKKYIISDVMAKMKLYSYVTMFTSFASFEDFEALARVAPQSEVEKLILEDGRWKTDEEFGRQFLSGVNPVLIRRCSAPLDKFPVTTEMVKASLERGVSLEEEMKNGHIYIIDYKYFNNIERRPQDTGRYLANPIVMFYVRTSGDLVPIAIQLQQKPGPDNPIWTPSDSALDWLLVKMFIKSADSHTHTMYTHLTRAHFVMEAFSMAFFRQLPCNHPVYKLLIVHSKYNMAGGQKGRDLLLNGEESLFKKLLSIPGSERQFISESFENFRWTDLVVPKDMAERGVDDRKKLPGYHFRDDAMLQWDVIFNLVSKIMSLYYNNDKDVAKDAELQAFVKDVHENGLVNGSGSPNGVPDKLNTLQELFEYLTAYIFTGSCFHSAMNYGQLDYFAYGPNYPSAMRKPPPTKRGETTMQTIIDTLPNKADQAFAIAFAHYLTDHLTDEIYLDDTESEMQFTEPEARDILEQFADDLREVSEKIRRRNTEILVPYLYLIPEHVPRSASQ